jgi:hypothetical protein
MARNQAFLAASGSRNGVDVSPMDGGLMVLLAGNVEGSFPWCNGASITYTSSTDRQPGRPL